MGGGVEDGQTAAGTIGSEVATEGMIDRAGLSGFASHGLFLSGNWGGTPSVVVKRVRNEMIAKELLGCRCARESVRRW